MGDPCISRISQVEFESSFKHVIETLDEAKNAFQLRLGNNAYDQLNYFLKYPKCAARDEPLVNLKGLVYRSEAFAGQLQMEYKHPGIIKDLYPKMGRVLYNTIFSVPGLHDFSITANRVNRSTLPQFPYSHNIEFDLSHIRNPIKIPTKIPASRAPLSIGYQPQSSLLIGYNSQPTLLIGYSPRPTLLTKYSPQATLYSYAKPYVPFMFKTFCATLGGFAYGGYLHEEYFKNPTGQWITRGTIRFTTDTALHGALCGVVGAPIYIPVTVLDALHVPIQALHKRESAQFQYSITHPTEDAFADAIDATAASRRLLFTGGLYGLSTGCRWGMDHVRTASDYISNAIIDSGCIDYGIKAINLCSEDYSTEEGSDERRQQIPLFKHSPKQNPEESGSSATYLNDTVKPALPENPTSSKKNVVTPEPSQTRIVPEQAQRAEAPNSVQAPVDEEDEDDLEERVKQLLKEAPDKNLHWNIPLNWRTEKRGDEFYDVSHHKLRPDSDDEYTLELTRPANPASDGANTSVDSSNASAAIPPNNTEQITENATQAPQPTYITTPEVTPFSNLKIKNISFGPTPGGGYGVNLQTEDNVVYSIGLVVVGAGIKGAVVGIEVALVQVISKILPALPVVIVLLMARHFSQKQEKRIDRKIRHATERTTQNTREILESIREYKDRLNKGEITKSQYDEFMRDMSLKISTEHKKIQKRIDYAWDEYRYTECLSHQLNDWCLMNIGLGIEKETHIANLKQSISDNIDLKTISISDITHRIKSFSEKHILTLQETLEYDHLIRIVFERVNTGNINLDELQEINSLAGSNIKLAQVLPECKRMAPISRSFLGRTRRNGGTERQQVYVNATMDNFVDVYQVILDVQAGIRTDITLDEAINNYNKAEGELKEDLKKIPIWQDGKKRSNAWEHFTPYIHQVKENVKLVISESMQPSLSDEAIRKISIITYINELNKSNHFLESHDPEKPVSPSERQKAFDDRHLLALKLKELNLKDDELKFDENSVAPTDGNEKSNTVGFTNQLASIIHIYEICFGKERLHDGLGKFSHLLSLGKKLTNEDGVADTDKLSSEDQDKLFKEQADLSDELLELLNEDPRFTEVINKSLSRSTDKNTTDKSTTPSEDDSRPDNETASNENHVFTTETLTNHFSATKKLHTLANGRYSLSTDITKLQNLIRIGDHDEAYELAKNIQLAATHSELHELCDHAILGGYRVTTALLTPMTHVVMHVLSDRVKKYRSENAILFVSALENMHKMFPSILLNTTRTLPFALHNDLNSLRRLSFKQFKKEMLEYKKLLPTKPTTLSDLMPNFNLLHQRVLTSEAVYHAYQYSAQLNQSIIDLLNLMGIDYQWFYDNYIKPKMKNVSALFDAIEKILKYISEQFGHVAKRLGSAPTESAIATLGIKTGSTFFEFKDLPKLSTITGIIAAFETSYNYITTFNLSESHHETFIEIVVNQAFMAYAAYYHPKGNRSENISFYRSKDFIKFVASLLVFTQTRNLTSASYVLKNTLILAYDHQTGNHLESVVLAKIDNLDYLLKDLHKRNHDKLTETKLFELAETKLLELAKAITALSQSEIYHETDSHTLKFARKFYLEINCHLLLRRKKYKEVLKLTDILSTRNIVSYHAMRIPVTSTSLPIAYRFEALLSGQENLYDIYYSEYNRFAGMKSEDKNLPKLLGTVAKKIVQRHVSYLVNLTISDKCMKPLDALNKYNKLTLVGIDNKNQLLDAQGLASLAFVEQPSELSLLHLLCTLPNEAVNSDTRTFIETTIGKFNECLSAKFPTDNTFDIHVFDQLDKLLYDRALELIDHSDYPKLAILLKLGAAQSHRYNLSSAFIQAAQTGNHFLLEVLIKSGIDVDITINSLSALHHAAIKGLSKTINFLHRQGANIDLQNDNGETALHLAIGHNQTDAVKTLLWLGASLTIADNNHETWIELTHRINRTLLSDIISNYRAYKYSTTPLNRLRLLCTLPQDLVTAEVKSAIRSIVGLINKLVVFIVPKDTVLSIYTLAMLDKLLNDEINVLAHQGNHKTLRKIFKLGANQNLKGVDLTRALITSAQKGHTDTTQLLIEYGANVNATIDSLSALHHAAMRGHCETIQCLIKYGAYIDSQSSQGRTPLHFAIAHDHTAAVKILLWLGASPDIADRNNETPRVLAQTLNQTKLLAHIIPFFSQHNSCVDDGKSPNYTRNPTQLNYLHLLLTLPSINAVEIDKQNIIKKLQCLIPEELKKVSSFTFDQLEVMLVTKLRQVISDNNWPLAKELLAFGAAQNTPALLSSLLHHAATCGHQKILKLLINYDADINYQESNGLTHLFTAVGNNHTEIVKRLLIAGADVNMLVNGDTALYVAAQNGHTEVVKLLLAAGANADVARASGATASYVAAQNGYLDIVKLLIAARANLNLPIINGSTPLYIAAENGHVSVVKALLNGKASIDQSKADGATPLLIAAQLGRLEIVELLLSSGANINSTCTNKATPLFVAAYNMHREIVMMLLKVGANGHIFQTDQQTPQFTIAKCIFISCCEKIFFAACRKHDVETASYMLDHGVDTFIKDEQGQTGLHIAVESRHLEMVEMLISKGAKPYIHDNNRETALELAEKMMCTDIIDILRRSIGIRSSVEKLTLFNRAINVNNAAEKAPTWAASRAPVAASQLAAFPASQLAAVAAPSQPRARGLTKRR